jgi:hypothetical protein
MDKEASVCPAFCLSKQQIEWQGNAAEEKEI